MGPRITAIMLVAMSVMLAQSPEELKRKYGVPIAETYTVRAAIEVTVMRRSDGRITELIIAPKHEKSLVRSRNVTFTREAATEVLDELVPVGERGKPRIGAFINMQCMPENDCAGSEDGYENVSIYFNASANAGRLCYVHVVFN